MRFQSGITDQVIYFVAVDSTDLKTRKTGLTTFTVYRSRNGGAATAFTTPTVTEVDSTNMPGVYKLLLDEDMIIDAGDDSEAYVLHITQATMAPVTMQFELYRPIITAGATLTVANGAADADLERIQGTVVSTPATAGILDVNLKNIANAAVSTSTAQLGVNVVNAGGTAWASGSLTSGVFAAGAINAAAIAADAIGASELAADAVAEIAAAVWDLDATAHQTQGTFGQAIGDPVADTNTIFKAVVTDATGATVGIDSAATLAAVDTEVAAIKTKTDQLTFTVANRVDSTTQALNDLSAAQVKTEVVNALNVDTYVEPGQTTPAATATLAAKINYLYKAWRNKKTQTASTWSLFNDDAVTVDQKSVVSDDGSTATRGEIATGP